VAREEGDESDEKKQEEERPEAGGTSEDNEMQEELVESAVRGHVDFEVSAVEEPTGRLPGASTGGGEDEMGEAVTGAARRAGVGGEATSVSDDAPTCMRGDVRFDDGTKPQVGNSCGPCAVDNAVTGAGVRWRTNRTIENVEEDWITTELAAAAAHDPAVSRHVYYVPSQQLLSPADNSLYNLGVDPIVSRMTRIDELSAGPTAVPHVVFVITPTDTGELSAYMTHFIAHKITWANAKSRADGWYWVSIDILETSSIQRTKHGARNLAQAKLLQAELYASLRSELSSSPPSPSPSPPPAPLLSSSARALPLPTASSSSSSSPSSPPPPHPPPPPPPLPLPPPPPPTSTPPPTRPPTPPRTPSPTPPSPPTTPPRDAAALRNVASLQPLAPRTRPRHGPFSPGTPQDQNKRIRKPASACSNLDVLASAATPSHTSSFASLLEAIESSPTPPSSPSAMSSSPPNEMTHDEIMRLNTKQLVALLPRGKRNGKATGPKSVLQARVVHLFVERRQTARSRPANVRLSLYADPAAVASASPAAATALPLPGPAPIDDAALNAVAAANALPLPGPAPSDDAALNAVPTSDAPLLHRLHDLAGSVLLPQLREILFRFGLPKKRDMKESALRRLRTRIAELLRDVGEVRITTCLLECFGVYGNPLYDPKQQFALNSIFPQAPPIAVPVDAASAVRVDDEADFLSPAALAAVQALLESNLRPEAGFPVSAYSMERLVMHSLANTVCKRIEDWSSDEVNVLYPHDHIPTLIILRTQPIIRTLRCNEAFTARATHIT
jgi:hypothetical protein